METCAHGQITNRNKLEDAIFKLSIKVMGGLATHNILRKAWEFTLWDLRGKGDLDKVMKINEETGCCH